MITAYFDDSGTHEGSLNLTVGGFVADSHQWDEFNREWSRLLVEFDLDREPGYFHMTDYESRFGPYAAWDNHRRRDFMVKLTGIIRRRVRAGIAASFPVHNFKRMETAMPDTFPPGYRYMTCAQVCWKNLGVWAESAGVPHIDSVFEAGTGGAGLLEAAHADLHKNHPRIVKDFRLGEFRFSGKKESMPLQAADFFAYETYKRMVENITNKKRWRKSVELVVSGIPVYATFLNDDATDNIVSEFKKRQNRGPSTAPLGGAGP